MFIDDVKLTIIAGDGGNGVVAFRREKYVPKGGPAGGDGGKGGDIIFIGDEGMTTLIDLKYRKRIHAQNGENGMPKNMYGKQGQDSIIRVPIGSVIHDLTTNTIIADITKHNQTAVIAKGGKGGRGNSAFATSRIPAPEIAERGEKGEQRDIRVELKVLADVGLIGFPSVGKSTLISVISAAKPKIAAYPFTTLSPQLGVVDVGDGRSFVVADLPGLIEGASSGAGLGFQFLRHIERTRLIVHILDLSGIDGRDPINDYHQINHELRTYDQKLMLRPQIVVANKMDIDGAKERLEILKQQLPNINIIPISAYTKENIQTLLYQMANILDTVKVDSFVEKVQDEVVEYTFTPEEEKFTIRLDDDGVYHVEGALVQKFFEATDFSRDENAKLFARRIRNLGVDDALRKKGVKHGDTVRILGYEFEFLD